MSRPLAGTVLGAVVAGILIGIVDLLCQRAFAYPWANLANSPALWGLAAFGVALAGRDPATRVFAGMASLVIAVLAYYVSAHIVIDDALANAWSTSAGFWYTGAIAVGLLGGLAASWLTAQRHWQIVLASVYPAALLCAEAMVQFVAAPSRTGWNANTSIALLLILIGLVLLVVVPGRGRLNGGGRRAYGAVVVAFAGLTAVGALGYHAVGLHGFSS